jgi:hypothetical protein
MTAIQLALRKTDRVMTDVLPCEIRAAASGDRVD